MEVIILVFLLLALNIFWILGLQLSFSYFETRLKYEKQGKYVSHWAKLTGDS